MTQECGFKINHASLEFGALVHPERVKFRKLGPPVLAPQSSTFFSANKNAESHDARVLSACDADFEALFFTRCPMRWLQMSGKIPATRRKRSNRRTRAEARRWRRPFSLFLTENGVCVFAFAIRTALRAGRATSTSKRAYLKREGYYRCLTTIAGCSTCRSRATPLPTSGVSGPSENAPP